MDKKEIEIKLTIDELKNIIYFLSKCTFVGGQEAITGGEILMKLDEILKNEIDK